jgi:hypothetical protein
MSTKPAADPSSLRTANSGPVSRLACLAILLLTKSELATGSTVGSGLLICSRRSHRVDDAGYV